VPEEAAPLERPQSVTRKANCKSESTKAWNLANERDVINTLRFKTTPGASNLLISHNWKKFPGCCPIALYAG
jgi:hypothetical protein